MTKKEALHYIENLKWLKGYDNTTIGDKTIAEILDDIGNLIPDDKTAEWIYGENSFGADGWRCSECGFFEPWYYVYVSDIDFIRHYAFCPACGSKMIHYTGQPEETE